MLTASLFDLTRQNVVTSDGVLFNRQIGKVNSRGIEIEAVGQLTPDLKLTGAYTWYDLKIEEGNPAEIGKVTTGTPEQFGSLWLDYAIPSDRFQGSARRPMVVLTGLAVALVLVLALAFLLGRAPDGFGLYPEAFAWRLPRVIAACGAGLRLGVAGCLVQRLFANPMASPEILGIGGGVAMGLITMLLIFAGASTGLQLFGATAGALAVTGAILLLGLDRGFTPERLLLTGIAITALLDASSLLFVALGDPRSGQVLAWLSGSTYWVELDFAVVVLMAGLVGLALSALACRWLEILPLGAGVATSLGIPLRAARLAVLALAAITTAAAALVVGPMSFVGLLAPHLAGLMGLRRAGPQLLGAAITGAALVVLADWTGGVVFAPTELPAGVLSVLIGSLAVMGW